jgi:hypothetical protein
MLANAFIGKPTKPSDGDLSAALGPAATLWHRLIADLAEQFDTSGNEWSSHSPKAGWSLKVKRGAKTVLYLSPCSKAFRASFALGDKAAKAAIEAGPPQLAKLVTQARRYAEGTGVRTEVKSARDLPLIMTLARCKLQS